MLEEQDLRIGKEPSWRALNGAAQTLKGRLEEAKGEFNAPELAENAEVKAWRALIEHRQGRHAQAANLFEAAADALMKFPPDQRTRFRLAAAKSAVETKKWEAAEKQIEQARKENPGWRAEIELKFAEARVKAGKGEVEPAIELYREVTDQSDNLHVRAEATLALINLEFTEGRIKRREAIERLQRLQFAWRNDELELTVLRRIAELQLRDRDFRNALLTMRYTVKYFAKHPAGKEIAREMNETFARLYLDGQADKLAPVAALGLYYEFRELSPPGRQGDQVLHYLADRLARIGLYEESAKVLEQQITFRLRGQDKIEAGAMLAGIYLLDNKPVEAIRILEATPTDAQTSPQAVAQRRLLQARAIADQNRVPDALKFIERDTALEADILRADLNWQTKNWAAAAEALERLVAPLARPDAAIEKVDRNRIMRLAVAYSLTDSRDRLRQLKQRFGTRMKDPPEGPPFEVLTREVDPGATNFRELATTIANVGALETFMTNYRDKLQRGALSAIN
ncbi:MAG: hypothetical protein FJX46_10855 [Alphaproteobacteria bacterium]|nr:hypothetical protein [Alphaproteobacteria bacterium]